MALLSSEAPGLIGNYSLQNWEVIGSGGFGQVYKARHCQWGCDVAVKLHHDEGSRSFLLHEAKMMRQWNSPYILQVLGVFQGRLPSSGSSLLGLVMEFMERGSLVSLQDALCGPPLWPLAFRLAHQVALGMNFLHSRFPPILHLNLKPNNVLLDSSLNAKLSGFGFARYSHSVTRASKRKNEEIGGTTSYMPPEAFDISYVPTRASDVYSYGILLWSIVTGKQPPTNAISSLVQSGVSEGDRPPLAEIDQGQEAGLKDLVRLMESCWVQTPTQRPSALDCTTVTEELYLMHKPDINKAVYWMLEKLDKKKEERRITDKLKKVHITEPSGPTDAALHSAAWSPHSLTDEPALLPVEQGACTTVTHEWYKMHESDQNISMLRVLEKLYEKKEERRITDKLKKVHITEPSGPTDAALHSAAWSPHSPTDEPALLPAEQGATTPLAVCMDTCDWIDVEPEVNTMDEVPTFRLQSKAGRFKCSVSALRWVCQEEVSFEYQFKSWEKHMEGLTQYRPAGPLLDIRVTAGKLDEVQLPHWICVAHSPEISDKFAVLHIDTDGVVVEQVLRSEVLQSHIKIFNPIFSPRGVLIRAGFPMKAMKQRVTSDGYKRIKKPNPDMCLQMGGHFILTTNMDTAEIYPDKLKLRYETVSPNFYEVFIRNASSDFSLTLESEQKRNKVKDIVWKCVVREDDYQKNTCEQVSTSASDQHFVDRHRTALIEGVSNPMSVLDELLGKRVISQEHYARVRAKQTSQEQMRDIFTFVGSAGTTGKDALYNILRKQYRFLISELEGSGL